MVSLTSSQAQIVQQMGKIIAFFFKGKFIGSTPPFRGFLLEGPPSSGKTEVAKQVKEIVEKFLKGAYTVELKLVDSASIAAPKWGEAESKLRNVFGDVKGVSSEVKTIILFDDIDCLMLKRGFEVAKEWHYSIDSLMFHELDRLDPHNVIIVATTNRPDLIDEALRSRLYSIQVPLPPLQELIEIAKSLLNESGIDEGDAEEILQSIEGKIKSLNRDPTIRDVQHFVVRECIERGVWEYEFHTS